MTWIEWGGAAALLFYCFVGFAIYRWGDPPGPEAKPPYDPLFDGERDDEDA